MAKGADAKGEAAGSGEAAEAASLRLDVERLMADMDRDGPGEVSLAGFIAMAAAPAEGPHDAAASPGRAPTPAARVAGRQALTLRSGVGSAMNGVRSSRSGWSHVASRSKSVHATGYAAARSASCSKAR